MVCRNFTLFILFLSFLTYSCQQPDTDINGDTGKLILRLTDAPFPHSKVSEVNIKIAGIKLEAEDHLAGFNEAIDLLDTPVEANLLELTNGITISLANTDIAAGRYSGLKLYLTEVEIVLIDRTVFDMIPRSDPDKGTETVLPASFEVSSGLTTDLLLDFDVSRSFMPRLSPSANLGIASFLFNPVIHVTDNKNTGSISGIVTSSLGNKISRLYGAQVSVMSADTLVTTTFTDQAGMYTVLGLKPGSYTVEAEFDGLKSSGNGYVIISPDKTVQQSLDLKEEVN